MLIQVDLGFITKCDDVLINPNLFHYEQKTSGSASSKKEELFKRPILSADPFRNGVFMGSLGVSVCTG